MTISPAFLEEVAAQRRTAKENLQQAKRSGDESALRAAKARLKDLEDITVRVGDESLQGHG